MIPRRGKPSFNLTDIAYRLPTTADSHRQLRKFGVLLAILLIAFFGLLRPFLGSRSPPLWPWLLGAFLLALAWVAPNALRHLYYFWQRLGLLLGHINSGIVLSILFFAVLSPLALVLRLSGRDKMGRRFDTSRASYRIVRSAERIDMRRQF